MKWKNREEIINWLYYEIGKQPESFKLTTSYIDPKTKEYMFFKHAEFLDLLQEENIWKLKNVNHRSVLLNELILDIDCKTKEESALQMIIITDKLKKEGIPFLCWFTGSRGYHIHMYKKNWLYATKEKRESEKIAIIKHFQTDGMKAHDGTMIALEETPHWKTGMKKELVMMNGHWE